MMTLSPGLRGRSSGGLKTSFFQRFPDHHPEIFRSLEASFAAGCRLKNIFALLRIGNMSDIIKGKADNAGRPANLKDFHPRFHHSQLVHERMSLDDFAFRQRIKKKLVLMIRHQALETRKPDHRRTTLSRYLTNSAATSPLGLISSLSMSSFLRRGGPAQPPQHHRHFPLRRDHHHAPLRKPDHVVAQITIISVFVEPIPIEEEESTFSFFVPFRILLTLSWNSSTGMFHSIPGRSHRSLIKAASFPSLPLLHIKFCLGFGQSFHPLCP